MALIFALLLAVSAQSVTIKQDQVALREGCDANAETIATLSSGAPVTIRYALSGQDTPCYNVSAQAGGKTVEGFLPASALDGLETFQQGIRDAALPELREVMGAVGVRLRPDWVRLA